MSVDTLSDGYNNVIKPFGQQDSIISLLHYYLFRLSCKRPRTTYIDIFP